LKSRSLLIVAVLLVAVVAGAYYAESATSKAASSSAKSVTIDIEIEGGVGAGTTDRYIPANFTVTEGEYVTLAILNTDDNTHGLVIKAFGVDTGLIDPGDTTRVSFLANETGTFTYYEPPGYCTGGYGNVCNSVQHMIGNMTVAP
jgi:nitrous oxide reductase